jgi:hypothetical protein
MRCTPMRCTPVRYTPMRYTPVRYTSMRCTPVRCTFEVHTYEMHAREMHAREIHGPSGTRLCARCTPVYVRCTSTRYTSGGCTSVGPSLPVNVYEIYGNFDFRKWVWRFSILALSDTVLICRHKIFFPCLQLLVKYVPESRDQAQCLPYYYFDVIVCDSLVRLCSYHSATSDSTVLHIHQPTSSPARDVTLRAPGWPLPYSVAP